MRRRKSWKYDSVLSFYVRWCLLHLHRWKILLAVYHYKIADLEDIQKFTGLDYQKTYIWSYELANDGFLNANRLMRTFTLTELGYDVVEIMLNMKVKDLDEEKMRMETVEFDEEELEMLKRDILDFVTKYPMVSLTGIIDYIYEKYNGEYDALQVLVVLGLLEKEGKIKRYIDEEEFY